MTLLCKQIEPEKGVLKYRLPNIAEGYEFLSVLDTDSEDMEGKTDDEKLKIITKRILKQKSRIAAKLYLLIDHKSVGHETFESLMSDHEGMGAAVRQIVDEVYKSIMDIFSKKV